MTTGALRPPLEPGYSISFWKTAVDEGNERTLHDDDLVGTAIAGEGGVGVVVGLGRHGVVDCPSMKM